MLHACKHSEIRSSRVHNTNELTITIYTLQLSIASITENNSFLQKNVHFTVQFEHAPRTLATKRHIGGLCCIIIICCFPEGKTKCYASKWQNDILMIFNFGHGRLIIPSI